MAVLSGYAVDTYSQSARLTLKMENTTIREVLKAIEDQSEFRFFYSGQVNVDAKTSVNVNEKNITGTLDEIFQGTGISYVVYGRQIALFQGWKLNPRQEANSNRIRFQGPSPTMPEIRCPV